MSVAADGVAKLGLPTVEAASGSTPPDGVAVDPGVDPAEQLTTMLGAGGDARVTIAAMKIALDTYKSVLDIIPR